MYLIRTQKQKTTIYSAFSNKNHTIYCGFLIGGLKGVSPSKSGRIVFAGQETGTVRNADSLQRKVFRQRRKTPQKQKQIASGRNKRKGVD